MRKIAYTILTLSIILFVFSYAALKTQAFNYHSDNTQNSWLADLVSSVVSDQLTASNDALERRYGVQAQDWLASDRFTNINQDALQQVYDYLLDKDQTLDLKNYQNVASSYLADNMIASASERLSGLPACASDKEFSDINVATCRPSQALVDQSLSRLRSEVVNTISGSDADVDDVLSNLSTIKAFLRFRASISMFMIASIVGALGAAAYICVSYLSLSKGLRRVAIVVFWLSIVLSLFAGAGLVLVEVISELLAGSESLTGAIASVAISLVMNNFFSAILYASVVIGAVAALVYLVFRLLRAVAKHHNKTDRGIEQRRIDADTPDISSVLQSNEEILGQASEAGRHEVDPLE